MVWEYIIIHVHFTFLQIHSNDLNKGRNKKEKTSKVVEQEMDADESLRRKIEDKGFYMKRVLQGRPDPETDG